jgi:hypothetical protein
VPTNHLLSFLNKPNDIKRNKSKSIYKSRVTEREHDNVWKGLSLHACMRPYAAISIHKRTGK